MSRTGLLVLLPLALAAQAPPADVDRALRARITEFYQDHINGKFRQAEQLVAEESKDFFYAANKPKYLSCEISRIDYSDDLTKAKATMVCEQFVPIIGFTDKPVKVPFPSRWKLVDGQWSWYVDPESLNQTPFGKMKPGAGSGASGLPGALPSGAALENMLAQVKADKSAVRLKADEPSSEQVGIVNQMPGAVTLAVQGSRVPGLEVEIDRTLLKTGEKAVVTFRSIPGKHRPVTVNLLVSPTNQLIPIQVTFE